MKTIFNWFVAHKTRAVLLASGWAAFIFAGCLLPGGDVPSLTIFQYDKLVHFGIFAVLAFLLLCTYRKAAARQALIVFLLCAAYGYAVELLQGSGLVEGRSCDPYDALADSLGALIGIAVFFSAKALWGKKSYSPHK